MIVLWFGIVFTFAFAMLFTNGIIFTLRFAAVCLLPSVAVGGVRWSIARGDRQQKIGGPIFGAVLLALTFWLASGFSFRLFGYAIDGWALGLVGAVIGLTVPLQYGDPPAQQNPAR